MTNLLDEFHTDRLLLRRIALSDLGDLLRMHADPEVMATLGGLRGPEETREYLERAVAHWTCHGFGFWTIRLREGGGFIGRGGLQRAEIEGREEVELAYALLAPWWGRGLATEFARAAVQVAFDRLRCESLIAMTLPTNHASRRVMEKAGLIYERDVVHRGLGHRLCRLRRVPGSTPEAPGSHPGTRN